jgi:hypothetical protein
MSTTSPASVSSGPGGEAGCSPRTLAATSTNAAAQVRIVIVRDSMVHLLSARVDGGAPARIAGRA